MANVVYTDFIFKLIEQEVDINGMNLKMVLLGETYIPDAFHSSYEEDIKDYERVQDTGYNVGGELVTNISVSRGESFVRLEADDVEWEASSITARFAVIYDTNEDMPVACYDFEDSKSSMSGTFAVKFPDRVFLQIGAVEC